MEISNIPIAFCVILGNLIICYIIITVLHVFILLNKIKSNQIKCCINDDGGNVMCCKVTHRCL